MDIEYQAMNTPPKRIPPFEPSSYNTPNKNSFDNPQSKRMKEVQQCYQSPPKRTKMVDQNSNYESSQRKVNNGMSTPPSSKKIQREFKNEYKNSNSNSRSNYKKQLTLSNKKVSQFVLSRLDQDYEILKTLGQGCFSSVTLCKSKLTGDLVAIKETNASSMSINEVQALGTLSIFAEKSKNIVKYYHSWTDSEEGKFYIVMEYCQGNLTNWYNQYRKGSQMIPEGQLKKFLKEALLGLQFMHQNRMVHLDIKPDNLLFKYLGAKNSGNAGSIGNTGKNQKILKIADLGLCRVSRIKKWTELDEGDSRYLAREILNYNQGIDLTKADIFSLGMALFQGMSLGNLPNNGEEWVAIRQKGINFDGVLNPKSKKTLNNSYSAQLIQIVKLMTSTEWRDRPSAAKLLENKYFREKIQKQGKRNHIFANTKARKSTKGRDSSL